MYVIEVGPAALCVLARLMGNPGSALAPKRSHHQLLLSQYDAQIVAITNVGACSDVSRDGRGERHASAAAVGLVTDALALLERLAGVHSRKGCCCSVRAFRSSIVPGLRATGGSCKPPRLTPRVAQVGSISRTCRGTANRGYDVELVFLSKTHTMQQVPYSLPQE